MINIHSFIYKNNLNLLVYVQHLNNTEIFNFDDYNFIFSSHITCDNLDNNTINDFFEFEFYKFFIKAKENITTDKKIVFIKKII